MDASQHNTRKRTRDTDLERHQQLAAPTLEPTWPSATATTTTTTTFTDRSLLPPTFALYDRRVTLPPGKDVDEVSLYALLRSWAHDDPKEVGGHHALLQMMLPPQAGPSAAAVGMLDNHEKIRLLVPADKVVADINTLFQPRGSDTDADCARRLQGIVTNAKKVRNRAKLLHVAHYSRVKDRLASKGIPKLAALEAILEECASLTPPRPHAE
jgi:hypothetical protein